MTKKRYKRIMATLATFLGVCIFLASCTGFFLVANILAESSARTLPSYAREDIAEILAKESWTEEDYGFLYLQTGLGKPALDELRGNDEKILSFQDALFYEGELAHAYAAVTTQQDILQDYYAPIAPLKNGDVLVTSSCHTFGWRNGHAALVVSASSGTVLESVSPGRVSQVTHGGTKWFSQCSNFIVLRLKEEYRTQTDPGDIAAEACKTLVSIPYSLTVGIFSKKDQGTSPAATHCSHLVWQAFKNFGYDIDSDGGPVVTSRDIANSPYFEVIQVYGFDPVQLW